MVFVGVNQLYALCILVGMKFRNTLAADIWHQCPIPKGAKTGSRESVVLSLYRCMQESPSKKSFCLSSPSSQEVLKQGEVVDLEHDVNGYSVTAEYFGLEVCVAYQAYSRISYKSTEFTDNCKSACFESEQIQTYETRLVCNSSGCGGGWKKLKFVVKFPDSAGPSTVMSFLVLIISAVLYFDFAF